MKYSSLTFRTREEEIFLWNPKGTRRTKIFWDSFEVEDGEEEKEVFTYLDNLVWSSLSALEIPSNKVSMAC